ncbi:MAG TPA: OmpA family protein [Anaeromyxobacteraceae bacterium]|nr:OmpA family protein [Anaeromyxobacteraceae bacterium]HUK66434.1 OmpA family protein [Anaeromyxobacteraceae bacterium]
MRRIVLLSLSVIAISLTGCSSKPKNGECKTSDDCKDQQGYGKVCVQGHCQECGADTDCQAGFLCRDNRCVPRPECAGDADCGPGRACQDGRCVAAAPKAECAGDADCGPGRACQDGRCVAKMEEAPPPAPMAACGGEDNAVHFAFDKADLDTTARGILEKTADCLKSAGTTRFTVEGHCDERGTTEYNLHLGERRAEAVKKYLGNLGLDPHGIRTTSYGKERPLCTEHNEGCWSRNRRGVVVTGG